MCISFFISLIINALLTDVLVTVTEVQDLTLPQSSMDQQDDTTQDPITTPFTTVTQDTRSIFRIRLEISQCQDSTGTGHKLR